MKRTIYLISSSLMILAMLLAACQPAATPAPATQAPAQPTQAPQPEPTQAPATSEKKVIGLVQINLSHPFHIGEVNGAKEAARRYGFELKVVSGEDDVNKQIQAFENLINEKVDAIAVNFIDVKAFGPAMEKAKAAGIPVVCLHSTTDGCATVLGFDEWYTGNEVGKYGVELLKLKNGAAKGKVANLQGLLGQGLNEARTGGWEEIMKQYPDIQVVAKEPTGWDPKKAVEIMENWLTAYPDLDLIYGNSDGLTVPAANTIEQAGRLWNGQAGKAGEQIIVTSVDGSDFALEAIQAGKMSSTFLYAPEYTGFWKAWVPFRIAMGETMGPETLIKGTLVNKDNVDKILQLAKDQKEKITEFPFEKTLPEIIQQYMGESAQPPAKNAADITVGLVQINLSHPFHIGEVNGAKEAARRYGFELKVVSGEDDVNKQIQAFENLINEKVDAIAVNFIDVKAFGPAMEKAKAAGIPVVCLHSTTDGCATVLGFDEWYTGNEVGKYGVELLKLKNGAAKGKVANLQGLLGQGLNEARTGGWEEIMKQYPDIQVVAKEPTGWDPKKAVEIMENWLTAYPDLDLIYGNSDGLTVPAANTIEQAGRLWNGQAGKAGEQIIVTSVDGSDFALEAIQAGKMSSTFLYAPEYTGFWKAWVPFRIAMGETMGPETLIKGTLVNKDNVDKILQLAKDQKEKITEFPFEKTLPEIIAEYMSK
jgi:ABC-type sugar transport system substrate-binding protein